MSLRFTILGCGSSAGVPRVGGDWGACDPDNPKNRRRRCSILVERGAGDQKTSVLVDTGPDMREQLISANVKWVDGVLYTHDHADHTHGIDDLRTLVMIHRKRIDVYMDDFTAGTVTEKFSYCFKTPEGSMYPPILNNHKLFCGESVTVSGPGGDISAIPFLVHHGTIDALGFRFGDLAYTPDLNDIPDETLPFLENLDMWVIDCLRRTPHNSHLVLEQTLGWIERMKPKHAILTNMHVDLDYEELARELPDGVEPAFDGMTLEV